MNKDNNKTIFPAFKCKSLTDLLRYRAEDSPNKVAYTFLIDGDKVEDTYTYAQLDAKARSIARHLQELKLTGERAFLLYPPGLEVISAFFGCLYAGVVAIPLPAPNPVRLNRTLPRLLTVSQDATPAIVLTTSALQKAVENGFEHAPELQKIPWLSTEEISLELASQWQPISIKGSDLCYLQYTSGSTSKPKGVMVKHENIIYNSEYARHVWDYTPDSISTHWMPYFHDYGLMDGIVAPLYNGIPVYLISPLDFLKQPVRWLNIISRYKVTHSAGPNFSYDLCVERFDAKLCVGMDLSSWRMASNAAEPIRKHTLERFYQTYKSYGFNWDSFYPSYGLAEATLVVSARKRPVFMQVQTSEYERKKIVEAQTLQLKESRTIVGCGKVQEDMNVLIVNPQTLASCQPDEVGEVWVSHPCVTQGYWQHSEESEKIFRAYTSDTNEGPFLRTGDLGFLKGQDLYITGRYRDLLIIHGRNHYPQDIELTIETCHPAVRLGCSAAFSIDYKGEEHLAIVAEVERRHRNRLAISDSHNTAENTNNTTNQPTRRGDIEIDAFSIGSDVELDIENLINTITEKIAEHHDLPIYGISLITAGTIHKTSSGKIQRQACRKGFLENKLSAFAIWQRDKGLVLVDQPQDTKPTHSNNTALNDIKPTHLNPLSQQKADELISWLRDYAQTRINSRLIDERRSIPPHIILDFGNKGLLGMQVPEQYEGLGLNYQDALRVFEQIAGIDISLGTLTIINNCLGLRPIHKFGSNKFKEELLPTLAKGRELAAFAITEPGAGSNPRAISALAQDAKEGGWRLQGVKTWSGSSAWAGVINVFTQYKNIAKDSTSVAGFAIRTNSKGLRFGPEALTMGMRGLVQNSIYLEDTLVGTNNLLGTLDGGLQVANDAMLTTRLALGAASIGGMKRSAQLMLRYASRRNISTGRLLDNPVSLARLSSLTAAITVMEAYIYTLAQFLDSGQALPVDAYVVCKTSGPEMLWQSVDYLVQMLGGRGYIETNIAPQMLRDARVFRIFEGPTETLNMFLGARIRSHLPETEQFLKQHLQAPAIADKLFSLAEEIVARSLSLRFHEPGAALNWAHTLIGEVATIGFLLAAIEKLARQTDKTQFQRAAQWAQVQFDQSIKKALSASAAESVILPADELTNLIYSYNETIGDIEQTLAGEDQDLDEMLRKDRQAAPTTYFNSYQPLPVNTEGPKILAKSESIAPQETLKTKITLNAQEIDTWLSKWIAKKMKLDISLIDSTKPFIYYGLDSVTGVMMAQDLEEYLGISLPATLAWDSPTINAVVNRVIQSVSSAKIETKDNDNNKNNELDSLLQEIGSISDEEAHKRLLKSNSDNYTG